MLKTVFFLLFYYELLKPAHKNSFELLNLMRDQNQLAKGKFKKVTYEVLTQSEDVFRPAVLPQSQFQGKTSHLP